MRSTAFHAVALCRLPKQESLTSMAAWRVVLVVLWCCCCWLNPLVGADVLGRDDDAASLADENSGAPWPEFHVQWPLPKESDSMDGIQKLLLDFHQKEFPDLLGNNARSKLMALEPERLMEVRLAPPTRPNSTMIPKEEGSGGSAFAALHGC